MLDRTVLFKVGRDNQILTRLTLTSISNRSYATEVYVYEKLYQERPGGFPFFPSVLGYGDIICSSIFPAGYILIISSVEGEQLGGLWDQLDSGEKDHIRQQCREAISVLRSFHIWLADAGKHNVIYSRDSKAVALIDFESIGDCTGEEDNLEAPELLAIFGRAVSG